MAGLFLKIDAANARLQTLVHRHARDLALAVEGREWRVAAMTGVDAALEAGADAVGAVVYARLGTADVTLWLAGQDWLAAAAGILEVPPEEAALFPEVLRRASLECFLQGALAALERASGLPVAVSRVDAEGGFSVPASACGITLVSPDGLRLRGTWVLSGDDGRARAALETALFALAAPESPLPADLPVIGSLCLGRIGLPARDAEDLSVGDVVLAPGDERYVRIGGGLRFAAGVRDGVLFVEGGTMTTEAPAADRDAETVSLDAVEFMVEARVGSVVMRLDELRRLCEGQVVEFGTPVESPASLVVNGRTIATGELADIGGRVGVRITVMAERS